MAKRLVQPRDNNCREYMRNSYGFFFFAKNIAKSISKNIGQSVSSEESPGMLAMRQKFLDYPKQSAKDPFKTASKHIFQK